MQSWTAKLDFLTSHIQQIQQSFDVGPSVLFNGKPPMANGPPAKRAKATPCLSDTEEETPPEAVSSQKAQPMDASLSSSTPGRPVTTVGPLEAFWLNTMTVQTGAEATPEMGVADAKADGPGDAETQSCGSRGAEAQASGSGDAVASTFSPGVEGTAPDEGAENVSKREMDRRTKGYTRRRAGKDQEYYTMWYKDKRANWHSKPAGEKRCFMMVSASGFIRCFKMLHS